MLRKLEALGGIAESIAKGLTAVALMSALWFWIKGPLNAPKYSFDASHPYFGFLPVLCYLYLRNINLTMREHALGLFKSIGRYSLEIYLLHHHLLLSNDGSSVLVLIPGYPKCNAVLAAIVLLYASKILKTITDILTAMMIHSNDGGKSVMNVVVLGSAILFAYLVALLLRVLGMVTLGTIATVAVVLGVVINQIVMDLTWNVYRRGLGVRAGVGDTPIVRASPSIIGTLMIFLLGLALHVAALTGANSQSRPLPSSCVRLGAAKETRGVPDDARGRVHRARLRVEARASIEGRESGRRWDRGGGAGRRHLSSRARATGDARWGTHVDAGDADHDALERASRGERERDRVLEGRTRAGERRER